MAYQIKGTAIINDNRAILGVSTAGINTALYVGDVEIRDNEIRALNSGDVTYYGNGSNLEGVLKSPSDFPDDLEITNAIISGYASVGSTFTATGAARFDTSIKFGATGQEITAISTDGNDLGGAGGASDNKLPTEKAVREYVAKSITGGVDLTVEGDTGTASIGIGNDEPLKILGFNDQIVTEMVSGVGGTSLVAKLADNVQIVGNLGVGTNLTVTGTSVLQSASVALGSTLTVNGEFELGSTKVNSIGVSSDLGGNSSSDSVLPTQKAVKDYVDVQVGGNADLRVGDGASGLTTVNLGSEQLDFISVANETRIVIGEDRVTVGVSSELVLGKSLTVDTDKLVVTETELTSSVPVTLNGNNADGVGLDISNGLKVGGGATISGKVKADSLEIGLVPETIINGISTDESLGSSDAILPTQKAVKAYVDGQTGAVGILSITGNDDSVVGEVNVANESLDINGVENQISVTVDGAGAPSMSVGFAQTANFPGKVSVASSLTATSGAFFGAVDATSLKLTGAGNALDVDNNANISGTLNVDAIQYSGSDTLNINGNGVVVNIVNASSFSVESPALFTNQVAIAQETGIGLTVQSAAYISGDLTVDGKLIADGGVDFDKIVVTGIEAEGDDPLFINGAGIGITIASTNDITIDTDLTTIKGDVTLPEVGSSFTIADGNLSVTSGQIQASDATGIGLTVKNDAYIGNDLEIDGLLTLADTAGDGLRFGGGISVNAITNTITSGGANNSTTLPTAAAVAGFISGGISDISLSLTDGQNTSGFAATSVIGIIGEPNQIVTNVASATTSYVNLSLPNELIAPGSIESTGVIIANDTLIAAKTGIGLSVANESKFDGKATFTATPDFQNGLDVTAGIATIGELRLGSDTQGVTSLNVSDTLAGATDSQLASAAAIKQYVDDSSGAISNLTLADAGNTNAPYYIPFAAGATGSQSLVTDADQLTYNPNSGILQAQEFNALSDIRYKENVRIINDPIQKIAELRGVTFDWKDAPGRSAGVIAQEVKAVMPDLITESPEKMTVNYNGLIGLLIEAVKELSDRVEELESK